MGGMGIVRYYSYLTDQFAFFMPMAAGMDLSKSTPEQAEWQVNKVFNVSYLHIQGLQDKFTEFVPRCKEQLALTESLEAKYGLKSKLKMLFMGADHDLPLEALKLYAAKNYREVSRNLYQKELWGTIRINDEWVEDNKKLYHLGSVPRYFWVEAIDFDRSHPEDFNFHAKVSDNAVQIDFPQMPSYTRTLRVYLHSSMVNLNKPVSIFVNQVKVAVRNPSKPHRLRSFDSTDPAFKFDDFVDLAI